MTAIAKILKGNFKQLLMRLSLRRLELHGTKHGNACMCIYLHSHFIMGPPPQKAEASCPRMENEQVHVCVNVATKKHTRTTIESALKSTSNNFCLG